MVKGSKAAVGSRDTAALHAAIATAWQEVQTHGLENIPVLSITDVSAEEAPEDYA